MLLTSESLGAGLELGQTLLSTNTARPVVAGLADLVLVVGLDGRNELGELGLVLRLDLTESENGGGLAADNGTETGLALDDHVRNTHLAAEGGKEDDELDGVNVIGDDDKVGLLLLNETDNVLY